MHYMWKWVQEIVMLGKPPGKVCPALKISHLGCDINDSYWELMKGQKLEGVRIIQGFGPKKENGFGVHFEKRPKREPNIKRSCP